MLPGAFPDDAKSGIFSEVEERGVKALLLPTAVMTSQDSSGILTLDTLAPSPKPKRKVQAPARCFPTAVA